MTVTIAERFIDFDGKGVDAGEYEGATIVRMGYAVGRANWFWNILQAGRVLAVTIGHPPYSKQVGETQ